MPKKARSKKNVREIALDILLSIEKEDRYVNLVLNDVINNGQVPEKDVSLLTSLVYGTSQHILTLEYIVDQFIKNKNKVDDWVLMLLQLSVYQMLYLDRIPLHAILNEAVTIAKKRGHQGIGGFVNGVLRAISRDFKTLDDVKWPTPTDSVASLAVQYSVAPWIIEKLITQVGFEKTVQIADSINSVPHLSIRIQDNSTSMADVIAQLEQEGVEVVPSPIANRGLQVVSGNILTTKLFADGLITIQDESAMIPVELMGIQGADQVFDACAAPGGKTVQIASYLTSGQVVASDIYGHKTRLILENATRLKVEDKIQVVEYDSRRADQYFDEASFDRILIDAPCSGLGLMRRKPDVKYRKEAQDTTNLHEIQMALLEASSSLLKVGGTLVYSTCTILQEENQETISKFIETNANFVLDPILEVEIKPDLVDNIQKDGTIQIFPDDFSTDGFYIARFKKIKEA